MRTSTRNNILAGIASALAASTALANGTRLPSQDDFVVARGYADVATADQASAVYYNPAGLAQLRTIQIDDGFYVLTPSDTYASPKGGSVNATTRTFPLPYGYFAVPLENLNGREITAAVGVYSPFGLSSKWPDNSGFRTLATSNAVTYETASFALAVPVTSELLIGGSWEFNHQHADLNRGLGLFPGDRFHFAGDGNAGSYDLGLLFQPSAKHSFGLNFQSKTNFHLTGTANLDPLGIAYSGYADWVYPEDVALGYSFRPSPKWNLEADWDWTNWRRLKTVVLYSAAAAPTPLPFNWQSSSYYNFGGTHTWDSGWDASAGFSISTNSIPDASFNPAVVDMTKVLYNFGPGFATAHWRLQSVVQWSPTVSRTITGTAPSPAGESANGTYRASLWAVGFGGAYYW
jgi:long-chain fatty acid transport protein